MKTISKIACAVALASGATVASATPLTELFFSQAAGWVDPVVSEQLPGDVTFSDGTATGAPAGTQTTMSWSGATSGTSMISIDSYDSDSSPDPQKLFDATPTEWNQGDIWAIDRLVQTNEVLSGGSFGNPTWVANTLANFRVFDDAVGGNEVLSDLNSATTLEFWETENTGTCAGSPSPLFDNGDGGNCDDRYLVNLGAFAPLQFVQDGYVYEIGFTLINGNAYDGPNGTGNVVGSTLICGFPTIVDARCDAEATPPAGQVAVYTPEIAPGSTEVFVAAFWTAREVPAPSALALLGAGLAGLGFAGRRKKVKA